MTRRQLVKLTADWQARLGLQEWRIAVVFGELPEMRANVDYNALKRWATITYNPAEVIGGSEDDDVRVAVTVVHELLHLMLVPLTATAERLHGHDDEGAEGVYRDALLLAEEVFVDRLAYAIVSP